MKRKTLLTVVALAAIVTALIYLAILLLLSFGILPEAETEGTLFTKGYLFLPLPLIGLLAGILLQVFAIAPAKKKGASKK